MYGVLFKKRTVLFISTLERTAAAARAGLFSKLYLLSIDLLLYLLLINIDLLLYLLSIDLLLYK